MATAPAPPVGLALPEAYTAMSPDTTRAKRPEGEREREGRQGERREYSNDNCDIISITCNVRGV